MTSKGKRTHHGEEESERAEPSGDLHALVKVLMESNARAEAERREERAEAARREEERENKREERKREEAQAAAELERQKQLRLLVID